MAAEPSDHVVLDDADITRTLTRMAHEIVERNPEVGDQLAVIGIHRRGAVLAQRLAKKLSDLSGRDVQLGQIDIAFYRDDLETRRQSPEVSGSNLDQVQIDGATLILVDDVLFTGRTVRAAIEALFDCGRPQQVQLAVLIDRGHRELPFRADYVGKNLPTARSERVQVSVDELDGQSGVVLKKGNG